MLQKNSFLQIFTSCYSAQQQQSAFFPSSTKLRSIPNKNQPKISLKKGRHQSFHEVKKLNSLRQLESKAHAQIRPRKLSFRQNQIEDLVPLGSSKTHENTVDNPHKFNQFTCKTSQFPPTKKFVQFYYQASFEKQTDQRQLQKTTKKMALKGKENAFSEGQTGEAREVKELNKEKFISNLQNYKQSLVSITFDSGAMQPQLQQSRIEVDFFHPSASQVAQLEKYLTHRK